MDTKGVLQKTTKPYDSKLIGIISTKPGVVMGSIDRDTGKADKRMLALAGRVPVKISPDSENIEIGDFLTSSDTHPGMAMKATRAGYTVAKAIESWQPGGSATIEAFVYLGYNMRPIELTLDNVTTDIEKLKDDNKQLQDRVSAMEQILNRLTQYGTNNPATNQ